LWGQVFRPVFRPAAGVPPGVWSFYIFSSGSSVNQGLIGDLETERRE
jgi:hypothetical protein